MVDKPTRNHWIVIVQDVLKSLRQFWFLLILLISGNNKYIYIGGAVIVVSTVVIQIKKWLNTEYYVADNMLVYKSGVFQKSREEIPFDKINTIDMGQGLFDRIFGLCTVKIDSGSAIGKEAELKLKIKYKLAEMLRDTVLNIKNSIADLELQEEKKEEAPKKVIAIREIIIYAITKGKLGWALGGYFAVMNFADDVEKITNTTVVKNLTNSIDMNNLMLQDRVKLVFIIIGMLLAVYIVMTLFSIIFEIVKLYNFTIKVQDKNFNISYGLISKKEYSIPIDKIHALKYKQGILQQVLGFYTIEAITIGYGDEKNEKAILYPIANENFKQKFLVSLLPEMIFSDDIKKPPKHSLKRFILMRVLLPFIIIIPLYLLAKPIPSEFKIAVTVVITLINILLGYLNYKNTSLGVTDKLILASEGSFIKTTTIIKQSSVQAIERKQNPYQRKAKVCDYSICVYSTALPEAVKVRHMNENLDEELYGNLIM
jgi:putative membrane protein